LLTSLWVSIGILSWYRYSEFLSVFLNVGIGIGIFAHCPSLQ